MVPPGEYVPFNAPEGETLVTSGKSNCPVTVLPSNCRCRLTAAWLVSLTATPFQRPLGGSASVMHASSRDWLTLHEPVILSQSRTVCRGSADLIKARMLPTGVHIYWKAIPISKWL